MPLTSSRTHPRPARQQVRRPARRQVPRRTPHSARHPTPLWIVRRIFRRPHEVPSPPCQGEKVAEGRMRGFVAGCGPGKVFYGVVGHPERSAQFGRPVLAAAVLALLTATMVCCHCCAGQGPADDESMAANGLLGEYRTARQRIRRIDPRPAFDWQHATPDVRLAREPFEVVWTGMILVRDGTRFQFHARVNGGVRVDIGTETVLETEPLRGRFVSGREVTLAAGEHTLTVNYNSPETADPAGLQIFWSSDAFPLEPLSADILTHESTDSVVLRQQASGSLLSDAYRCAACHADSGEPDVPAAPDLDHVAAGNTLAILRQRLLDPADVVPNTRMPHFGLSPEQADQIAAWLLQVSEPPSAALPAHSAGEPGAHGTAGTSGKTAAGRQDDAENGTVLLRSLGCVACHEVPGMATAAQKSSGWTHAAPSLVGLAQRRSREWLTLWLQDPERLNASHRMPVFELTESERQDLVAALSPAAPPDQRAEPTMSGDVNPPSPEFIAAGRALIIQTGCASCHRIPGMERPAAAVRSLVTGKNSSLPSGCLSAEVPVREDPAREDPAREDPAVPHGSSVSPRTPRFRLPQPQRDELAAWFSSANHRIMGRGSFDRGQLLTVRHGCTACHDRDFRPGLSEVAAGIADSHDALRGRSQLLIPPALTAVGDKLQDDVLRLAVSGKQPVRRLPWLAVRMPVFRHSETDLSDLQGYLRASDRIPDEADAARPEIAAGAVGGTATADELLLGNHLTGAGGFNCVACHSAGEFSPRNVALGSRGSDLLTMGSRLRGRYFLRWMKNPIRVVPGIEMPAIRRAAPAVLNESLHDQIAVIWRALSNPRFTAPTVVSRYEEFAALSAGERPRVIRDVFTLSEARVRESVARAMAIGFENRHSLLLDLDTMQLRQWTVGEFARQRTEGKSWYWSLAGVTVAETAAANATGPSAVAQFTLVSGADSAATERLPVEDEARTAELIRYSSDQSGVTLRYRLYFAVGAETSGREDANDDDNGEYRPLSPLTAWNNPDRPVQSVEVEERIEPVAVDAKSGWQREFRWRDGPRDAFLWLKPAPLHSMADFQVLETVGSDGQQRNASVVRWKLSPENAVVIRALTPARVPEISLPVTPRVVSDAQEVTTVPGFRGRRLPLATTIMPTAITCLPDGRLALTSLRGHVWLAEDRDGDGLHEQLQMFEEGLAAPFGILADGDSLIVSHKPEILRLRDTDGDGRADQREVVAAGWGYSDNYHDWTTGLIRDAEQNLFVGLGTDHGQKERSRDRDRWRGTVLRIDPSGIPSPVAWALRYPMGLAFDSRGHLFATDNQGIQNTFNEINHIRSGQRYGVPSQADHSQGVPDETAAIQIPHPWTRSVNSVLFLPQDSRWQGLAGHGIGCEYDLRFLIRFTIQDVDGVLQGAAYPFSRPMQDAGGSNFIGPMCSAVSPEGDLYIGCIRDSGWQGGLNTGAITRLSPEPETLPNGIQEVTATATGFRVTFFGPIDQVAGSDLTSYTMRGYTRVWAGSYATPDSDEHSCTVQSVQPGEDGRTVLLRVRDLKPGHVYQLNLTGPLAASQPLWPAEAHYSLKSIPKAQDR